MDLKQNLILYVDDEWSNRFVFEQSFAAKYRVRTVASAAEALEVLREEQAAVVLTDQRMPEMGGHELLQRVKALYPESVRVVITAYSDLDPILRAVNEGLVHRYHVKPWTRAELEQTLRWCLEAYALGRENMSLALRLMETERLVTLGSIGASMLHDLHQPLSHMALNVQRLGQLEGAAERIAPLLAQVALPAPERQALGDLSVELPDIVRDLRDSCTQMRGLLDHLRQMLNPTSARTEPMSTEPVGVARYAISVCREPAVRAQGRILYDGPRELPAVAVGATELAQAFINLIANAAQALERRGPGGRVTVTAADLGPVVRFTVTDDGPGMPPEVLARVGTPFFSTRKEGTGLGIAQARRVVEGAGGTLELASTVGVGTTATVTLPKAAG